MIPAIAPQSSFPVNRTASPTRTSELEAVTQPGKSGQAVGQLAKAAIAAAQMDGVELPRNAQGAAASAIARGADPEKLFMLQTE